MRAFGRNSIAEAGGGPTSSGRRKAVLWLIFNVTLPGRLLEALDRLDHH